MTSLRDMPRATRDIFKEIQQIMNLRKRKSSSSKFFVVILILLFAAGGAAGFILFFEGEAPSADLGGTSDFLGRHTPVTFKVTDSRSGIKSIRVTGSQKDSEQEIFSVSFPRTSYQGSVGPREVEKTISFDAREQGFSDGELTLSVTVQDFSLRGWFQGNRTVVTRKVMVDTVPPKVHILHAEKYITQGGAGIAIYSLSDKESRHGVEINGKFHPGFLLGDGRDDTYIAYFAVPYDATSIENLNISATDPAGNTASIPFTTVYKKAEQKNDTINVGDNFLDRKIPEFQQYYPDMQGENIDKFLYANRELRVENNTKIQELCNSPESKRLWQGEFYRMAGSSRAGFADHRTYFYQQKPVDKQVHLGMDIASTRKSEVKAANSGKVVFSDYLGIYGNMILLDHGQGVFSLYSHLSRIDVQAGDTVEKKQAIGLTGTTGMAGGDHLHFSMLVNGIFVIPKEWWDPHWIQVTVEEPITDSKF
jgi:murein DD-endopeptidase MepM/ murein hydrolase activator NlpD